MASNSNKPQGETVVRVPFLDGIDLRPGQEGSLTKDRYFLNGFFEPIRNPMKQQTDYHFIKRPGYNSFMTISSTGPGRGLYFWKKTNKVYSVNNNKIFANQTDMGVTLGTTSGFVEFAETRPGATTQYLGINDGLALYLIAQDDSVIVMNNVAITSSSIANPTVITANSHGLNTGNKIIIRNHTGSTPSLNDTILTVTRTGANTFTVPVNVTVAGTGGTIGVFPAPNTGDLEFMDGYWFVIEQDAGIRNCSVDDPTTWPATGGPIFAQMLPGVGVAIARQNNVLVAFTDRHLQLFYDAANPVGSPLANIEQGEQQIGCVGTFAVASNENTIFWISNTLTGGYSVCRLDGTTRLQDIGTASLRRSLTNNFFSNVGGAGQKQIILNAGTSWTVPADFNAANNTIEAIGGGGGGQGGVVGFGGDGGGGGAYAKITNFNPAGATSIPYVIGNGGAGGVSPSGGQAGQDTTFNVSSLVAKAGNPSIGGVGGLGGSAAASTGTVKFSGGNGGTLTGNAGGGGGGAGGKQAAGANGQNAPDTSTAGHGGQGDPLLGGAGGVLTGGGNGTEWNTTGSGGGGSGNVANNAGFNGGSKGGGGGGAGSGAIASNVGGGNGTSGVIVITYTPTAITDSNTCNGYILRISGHIFYIINLLNSQETWVYDQELNLWYKWAGPTLGAFPMTKTVQASVSGQAATIVGQDQSTGALWNVSQSLAQDNGTNFEVRVETLPLDFGDMERDFYNRVELVGDIQTNTAPISISYSDDDYVTFSTPRVLDMSNRRVYSEMWGQSRRRVWRISYVGDTPMRVFGFEFTIEDEAD